MTTPPDRRPPSDDDGHHDRAAGPAAEHLRGRPGDGVRRAARAAGRSPRRCRCSSAPGRSRRQRCSTPPPAARGARRPASSRTVLGARRRGRRSAWPARCMQGLTRNPLADPGILGINAGAALAMVLAISVLGVSGSRRTSGSRFLGAAVAASLVHAIAVARPRRRDPGEARDRRRRAHRRGRAAGPSAVLLVDRTDAWTTFRSGRSAPSAASRDLDVLLTGLPFLARRRACSPSPAPASSTRSPSATTSPRGLGRRTTVDRLVIGLAIVLLAGTATAARRTDRVRRADRAARRARPGRAPTTAACCRSSARVGAALVAARRHRRPRRAAAGGGPGRDHDRRRRACPFFLLLIRRGRMGRCDGRRCSSRRPQLDRRRVRRAGPPGPRPAPPPSPPLVVGGSRSRSWRSSPPGCCSATTPSPSPTSSGSSSATEIPGRVVHPDGEQAPARRARASLVGLAFGVGGRDLPDHAAQPAGQPRHHRRQPRRQRRGRLRDRARSASTARRSRRSPSSARSAVAARRAAGRPATTGGYRLVLVGVGLRGRDAVRSSSTSSPAPTSTTPSWCCAGSPAA